MTVVIGIILPLAVGFILLSLGFRLSLRDFTAIGTFPKPYVIGILLQLVLVPLTTLVVVLAFGLSGGVAVGFVLVAACPGGGMSNLITRFGNGDIALSVALTATTSLLCALSVPFHLFWAQSVFLSQGPEFINIAAIALRAFLITVLPIALGMTIAAKAPDFAKAAAGPCTVIATTLMALIIAGAVAANWTLFVANLSVLGGAVIVLGCSLIAVGYGVARVCNLRVAQAKTLAIEAGVQNTSIGLSVAAMIGDGTETFSAVALASGLYGVAFYFMVIPFALIMKHRS